MEDSTNSSTALLSLPPELAHHVTRHLTPWGVQQFAATCRHAFVCSLCAVHSMVLSHKCLKAVQADRMPLLKHCTAVTLRPRTMEELSKLSALLLVHSAQMLPSLSALQLQLLHVYDKQCDDARSLILKSVALHVTQLTQLHVEQEAPFMPKALAAAAELPLLIHLAARSRGGFEPGALGQLARAVNTTHLHLEVIDGRATPSSSGSSSSSSSCGGSSSSARSPSELARLQAADEVGLPKLALQLRSLTAIGLSSGSGLRAVDALLAAAADKPRQCLSQLQLGGGHELSAALVDMLAATSSLASLSLLPSCSAPRAGAGLNRLSCLTGLVHLAVLLPCMPPSRVVAAWAKGCRRLSSLSLCAEPGPQPMAPAMEVVTELRLLSASAAVAGATPASSRGSTASGSGAGLSSDFSSLAVSVRSPLSLAGMVLLWPNLVSLEVAGWALDSSSIAAIKLLHALTRLVLRGGPAPGATQHARTLLPLLSKPGLRALSMLDVSGISDEWVAEAARCMACGFDDDHAAGVCGAGRALRELHLRAPAAAAAAPLAVDGSMPCAVPVGTLTDDSLVQLALCWPRVTTMTLANFPAVTLAGVTALVARSCHLMELRVQDCVAVGAAPAESIAKAAVGAPGRAVDLWVS